MQIRKSKYEDEAAIMKVFAKAREYMFANGNKTQWVGGYPGKELLNDDILRQYSYVFESNGKIIGTFTLIIGEEPTYRKIKNGVWHSDKPYGTIHRLASDGTVKGVAKACFNFCANNIDYLRIDTHRDNITMQAAIQKFGFKKCGTIFLNDGSERIAYDYIKSTV